MTRKLWFAHSPPFAFTVPFSERIVQIGRFGERYGGGERWGVGLVEAPRLANDPGASKITRSIYRLQQEEERPRLPRILNAEIEV